MTAEVPKAALASTPRDWLLVFAACLTALSVPLAVTAPSVALSLMGHDLNGSPPQTDWVVNGYLLTFGSFAMPAGSLADLYGRRRMWLIGLGTFTLVTVLASASPSLLCMDTARLVQGACAALALSATSSSLAQRFRGHDGAWAFSLIGTSFGVSLALGPLVDGWLIGVVGWKALFYVTAMLTLFAALLVVATPSEQRQRLPDTIDLYGAASFTAAIAAFTWAVLQAPSQGWLSASCLIPLAMSAALAHLLLCIEWRAAHPMLDVSLLRDRRFVAVQFLALALAFVYIVPVILLPERFMGVDGDTALRAGQRMVALPEPLFMVPSLSGWVSRRVPVAHMAGLGLLLSAAGLLLVVCSLGQPRPSAVWHGLVLVGVGIGMPCGLVDGLAISAVPPEKAGMAAGFFNAIRITADGVAVACETALLSLRLGFGFGTHLHDAALAQTRALASVASTGDLNQATILSSQFAKSTVVQLYDAAFRYTFIALAAFAVASAVLVFVLLRTPAAAKSPLKAGAST